MKVAVLDNKTGKEKLMAPRYAKVFERLGRGRYSTRDMVADAPVAPLAPLSPVANVAPVAPEAPEQGAAPASAAADAAPAGAQSAAKYVIQVDGADVVLDDLDAPALHELAKKLEIRVHHASGAEKVRTALLESQGAATE